MHVSIDSEPQWFAFGRSTHSGQPCQFSDKLAVSLPACKKYELPYAGGLRRKDDRAVRM